MGSILGVAWKATMVLGHTLEQNGVVERRHSHIVKTGLVLLHYAKLTLTYWTHSFQTTVYLINRLPSHILNNQSPFQHLFHTTQVFTHLNSNEYSVVFFTKL